MKQQYVIVKIKYREYESLNNLRTMVHRDKGLMIFQNYMILKNVLLLYVIKYFNMDGQRVNCLQFTIHSCKLILLLHFNKKKLLKTLS